jgi:hypothetical protein
MANPDILFRGIPRGPTRGYSAEVLAAFHPKKVVIPCTGSFSLAHTAIGAGVKNEGIFCGDISLYSHALGMAIMGDDYDLELKDDFFQNAIGHLVGGNPIDKAAAVLFAIRVLQYRTRKKKSFHWIYHERERMENSPAYIQQLREQLESFVTGLAGITYRSQDMWVSLDQFKDEKDTVLLINPPRYTGGYDKMFEGVEDTFAWEQPEYTMFTEDDYVRMMNMLSDSPAIVLMYYATPKEDPSYLWGDPWRAVFADRPGSKRDVSINWIIANRSPVDLKVSRTVPPDVGSRYRLFTDEDEVIQDSVLFAKKVDKPTGDYYRDLFIHRLEGGQAEAYVALFLDGKMFGIAGVNPYGILETSLRASKEVPTGLLTFCFTVESNRYKRLQKLALMSICSEWLWEIVYGSQSWYQAMGAPERVETTMLTRYPEVKTSRGVMKLLRREPGEPPHKYKLLYGADIEQRTPQETIAAWLEKWKDGTK